MAEIVVTVNTSDKTSSVTIDGVAVENVRDVCLSLDSYFSVEISSREKMDDDTYKITRVVAEKEGAAESKKYPGLYEKQDVSVPTKELAQVLLKRELQD